jgi:hypothetical protein
MAEGQVTGVGVHVDQPRALRGSQIIIEAPPPAGCRLQDPKVPGAIQDGEQEQIPGRRRQAVDPQGEQSLHAPAQGQYRRQGPADSPLRANERGGQLHQDQRVSL